MRRLAALALITVVSAGCGAADLGADGSLPACNARPVEPADYEPIATERIEGETRSGYRYAYRGPAGEEVAFYFGVSTDAGADLPKVTQLPLATLGGGQLSGQGSEWTLTWNDQFPCDRMRVVGNQITKKEFVRVLSLARVIPSEEEEGEAGAPPGVVEAEEELEGEIEGLPTGPALEFVGVLATALEPGGLRPTPPRLERLVGDNAWSGAVHCWRGLARSLGVAKDDWMVAVVARTGNELDFVLEQHELTTIFYGQLKVARGCTPQD